MAIVCRGVRGATTTEENSKEAIFQATKELLEDMVTKNDIETPDIAAAFFTTTTDLNATFPAAAAREMGWESVPLMCSHEMQVPDALERCIRIMILLNTYKPQEEISHSYLRKAINLRG
jgi:chorismate mutase